MLQSYVAISLVFIGLFSEVYGRCSPPYHNVAGMCIYVESLQKRTWSSAREYCKQLAGDGMDGDLLSTPTCDQFTMLARYMEINDKKVDETYYVGVTRVFGRGWSWLTLETLPLGVPFWGYDQGNMDGMDCAAVDGRKNYQLGCSTCSTERHFICSMGALSESKVQEEAYSSDVAPRHSCPDGAVEIGRNCYIFYKEPKTWQDAENTCRNMHHADNGALFYPSTCDEFTKLAHHLAADEADGDWWVGAIDTTGNHYWDWVHGVPVPGGVPYWAYDEPSHTDCDHVKEHCGILSSLKRMYLKDAHCDELHHFVCKVDFW